MSFEGGPGPEYRARLRGLLRFGTVGFAVWMGLVLVAMWINIRSLPASGAPGYEEGVRQVHDRTMTIFYASYVGFLAITIEALRRLFRFRKELRQASETV